MAPKKQKGGEEVLDAKAPPENDDERVLVVTVSALQAHRLGQRQTASQQQQRVQSDTPRSTVSASTEQFQALLNAPYFTLQGPPAPEGATLAAEPLNARSESLQSTEKEFQHTLFQKKIVLSPHVVSKFVGEEFRLLAHALPESAAPQIVPSAKQGGKGGKGDKAPPAPKASAKQGDATNRSEAADASSEPFEILNFGFSLAGILTKSTKDTFVFSLSAGNAINGFESVTLTLEVNAPLLSPANIIKYPCAIVEVCAVRNIPPLGALDPAKNQQERDRSVTDGDAALLRNQYGSVYVTYSWLGKTDVATQKVAHNMREIKFAHKRVLFFHQLPMLEVLQTLFATPLKFMVRDREPKPSSPTATIIMGGSVDPNAAPSANSASAVGVAPVSLRLAVEGTTRFVSTTQVVPSRLSGAAEGGYVADYLSYGTTLQTKIIFSHPLPFVTFVPPASVGPAAEGSAASASPKVPQTPSETPRVPQVSNRGGKKDAPPPSAPLLTAEEPPGTGDLGDDDDSAEDPASFLSRVVLVMPYRGDTTSRIIRAVMSLVMKHGRPSGPESDVTAAVGKKSKQQKALEEAQQHAAQQHAPSAKKGGNKGGEDNNKAAAAPSATDDSQQPALPLVDHIDGTKRAQLLVSVQDDITGFEFMDGERRVIVIEGIVPALARVAEVAASVAGDDQSVKILFNYELSFLRRDYLRWPSLVLPLRPPVQVQAPPIDTESLVTPSAGKGGKKGTGADAKAGAKSATRATPDKSSSPRKGGTATTTAVDPSADQKQQAEAAVGSDAGELDAGGVGGRLRRIRLGNSFFSLKSRQANYLRRVLTHDALTCIEKLCALVNETSVQHAVDRDFFPTNTEVVALERVAGQCLSMYDLCASEKFYSFEDTNVDDVVAEAIRVQQAANAEKDECPFNFKNLAAAGNAGRVVSFVARPSNLDECHRLPILSHIAPRYEHKAYLHNLEANVAVRCAFSGPPPTQQLRFQVNAQLVGEGKDAILFVLSYVSLAKRGTDSRNPAFVEKKKRDEKRLPASEYFSLEREARQIYKSQRTMVDPWKAQYRNQSSDDEDDFVEVPPKVPTGLERNEIGADRQDAHYNFPVLNRMKVHHASTTAKQKKDEARAQEEYHTQIALEVYQEQNEKTRVREEKIASLQVKDDRAAFSTLNKRSAVETNRHVQVPSASRVDDLKQPWEPPATGVRKVRDEDRNLPPLKFDGARTILTDPLKVDSVFGGRKVELVAQEAADRQKELDDWKSKIVVDTLDFKVPTRKPRDVPDPINKYQSILDGEPKKHTVKKAYAPPPPVSIRTAEREVKNARVERSESKHPDRRQFYYAKEGHEKLKKIAGLSPNETKGPLWYPSKDPE